MSEQDITQEDAEAQELLAEAVEAETAEEPFDAERAKAKIAKANAEAANLRRRLKELEPLAARAKELEDAGKSETEKLTERMTAAEKRAQEAELRALRLEVAHDKGLTAAQARRLVGSTREELEADADELLETFGVTKSAGQSSSASGRPRERLLPGATSDTEPADDPDAIAEAVLRKKRGF